MLDEQSAREFAERYAEAWNSHDAELIEPLVTPDVVWLDPALGIGGHPFALVQLLQPAAPTVIVNDKDAFHFSTSAGPFTKTSRLSTLEDPAG